VAQVVTYAILVKDVNDVNDQVEMDSDLKTTSTGWQPMLHREPTLQP